MKVCGTCASCDELMTVIDVGHQTTHPLCPDPVDYIASLTARFLAAANADTTDADTLAEQLDAVDRLPPRLGDAALIYASWGWPVFPLVPGGKTPATKHGFKEATTDPTVIRAWWARTPAANIGLPTGLAFDVVDVDYDKPGAAHAWATLRDSKAMPPVHGIGCTPGGLHALIEPTGGGNGAKLAQIPGLDYRGRGGYIVAPPSVRPDGRYMWWSKPSSVITAATGVAAVA